MSKIKNTDTDLSEWEEWMKGPSVIGDILQWEQGRKKKKKHLVGQSAKNVELE